ncbi:lectin BRA-3-like [Littorina saxatilis]|uniref:lectin BRA-3-like n=1 Tax=Littorina saxatilis TaxID=31220 RepID=UPI0038B4C355
MNHLNEQTEIKLQLNISGSNKLWVGAKYNGSVYEWDATGVPIYFLRALNIDRSAGDCLVLSTNGLQSADCSAQHSILCQKEPNRCPMGEMIGPSGHCYFLESTASNWDQARQTCQRTYSGDLAVLSDHIVNTNVLSTLGVSSPTWMGLAALDLLGHFSWVDGESLIWNNWASSNWQTGVQWPCASVAASGLWEPTACDQSLPFICQYSLDGEFM